jgi:hypothetical protein
MYSLPLILPWRTCCCQKTAWFPWEFPSRSNRPSWCRSCLDKCSLGSPCGTHKCSWVVHHQHLLDYGSGSFWQDSNWQESPSNPSSQAHEQLPLMPLGLPRELQSSGVHSTLPHFFPVYPSSHSQLHRGRTPLALPLLLQSPSLVQGSCLSHFLPIQVMSHWQPHLGAMRLAPVVLTLPWPVQSSTSVQYRNSHSSPV